MPKPENEVYTHGHHAAVVAGHASRTIDNSAAFLTPLLTKDMALLDLGCGPGTISVGLAGLVDHVTAVDNVEDVLAQARAHAVEQGTGNVTFENVNAYDLPYDDDSFDVAYAHQVMQHLVDPVAAMRELHRVLKPAGIVALRDSDYATMMGAPPDPMIDRWRELYHQVARHNHAEPDAGRFLLGWAQQAGFVDCVGGASAWCFADEAGREFWGELWAVRTVESAFGRTAVEAGLATEAELLEIQAAWRRWKAAPDGWFAFVHGELIGRAS